MQRIDAAVLTIINAIHEAYMPYYEQAQPPAVLYEAIEKTLELDLTAHFTSFDTDMFGELVEELKDDYFSIEVHGAPPALVAAKQCFVSLLSVWVSYALLKKLVKLNMAGLWFYWFNRSTWS